MCQGVLLCNLTYKGSVNHWFIAVDQGTIHAGKSGEVTFAESPS
jgi:hypothetical protein